MDKGFQLFPDQASSYAPQVDHLYLFLCALTVFFSVLIFVMIVFLALKYRRRPGHEASEPLHTDYTLEIVWTVIPLIIVMVIFFWGARVYFTVVRPPSNTLDIHVVGKQWMWKIQHPEGPREINALHIPRGVPIKLTMASQDVIHSFYIPAFRVKQDVLPGRYSTMWFQADQIGEYHLFCAEYCGTQHSGMIGKVVVMEPEDYQDWLSGTIADATPVEAGKQLFTSLGCITCHGVQAPSLAGLYGSQVRLRDGSTVTADEMYIRDAILNSTDQVVDGYQPIMPSFRGQITEEQLFDLTAYIKSLKDEAVTAGPEEAHNE